MKLVFLGPPGSGKGTYASRIAPKLGIAHVSTGDILREAAAAKTPIGLKADEYMKVGKPVPDKIMADIIKNRLKASDCINGFILDCPYNVAQAQAVDVVNRTRIDIALNMVVPQNVLIARLTARRVCQKCGEIYNLRTKILPKVEGICDKCGGLLIHREDDKEAAVKVRLAIYEERARLMLKYYAEKGKLVNIEWKKTDVPPGEVDIPPDIMVEKILKILRKFK